MMRQLPLVDPGWGEAGCCDDAERREECPAELLGKGHFRALHGRQTPNRPVPALMGKAVDQNRARKLQREVVRSIPRVGIGESKREIPV
jgi:hypothetical protein